MLAWHICIWPFSPANALSCLGLYSVYSGMHTNTCFAIAARCLLLRHTATSNTTLMCGCIMHQLLCYAGTGARLSKGSQLWYRSSPLCAIPLMRTSQQICCHLHWKLLKTLPPLAVTPFTLGPQSPQQQLRVQLCCSCKLLPNKQTSLHLKLLLTVRTSQCLSWQVESNSAWQCQVRCTAQHNIIKGTICCHPG